MAVSVCVYIYVWGGWFTRKPTPLAVFSPLVNHLVLYQSRLDVALMEIKKRYDMPVKGWRSVAALQNAKSEMFRDDYKDRMEQVLFCPQSLQVWALHVACHFATSFAL